MRVIQFNKPQNENGYLSNSYPCSFKFNKLYFSSVEQFIAYQKALAFNDQYRCEKIMQCDDIKQLAQYSKGITNFNDKVWNGMVQSVVYRGCLLKFQQNAELAEKLLATGNNVIALCDKMEKVWGNGLNPEDSRNFSIDKWQGTNLTGFILMQVRSAITKG